MLVRYRGLGSEVAGVAKRLILLGAEYGSRETFREAARLMHRIWDDEERR